MNRLGDGKAWYLATRPDPQVLHDVLESAGITVTTPADGVEIVERGSAEKRVVFVINHSEVEVRMAAHGTELLSDEPVSGALIVPAGQVRVLRRRSDVATRQD